jgi:hypothetical protein
LKNEKDEELISLNLCFKKEDEKEKWFNLLSLQNSLKAETDANAGHRHDFEKERPKSAIMVCS